MAEMRKVQLTDAAKAKGLTSTYFYENQRYFLDFNTTLNVRQEVASGWTTADSNVVQMSSDKE